MKLPDGWKEVKLGECCFITDGDHLPPPKVKQGIPFIIISNIQGFNHIDFTNTMFVPQEYYDSIIESRKVQKNDILYTVVGSYGIPVLNTYSCPFCFQRHIALIRPLKILPAFLLQVMGSPYVLQQADKKATGEAQKTVSLASLRTMSIYLPLEIEQKAIADTLSAWDSMIEKTKKLIDEKEKKYSWFMEKVFSVKGKKGQVLVKKFAQEVSIRNSSLSVTQVLSVTNKNGFVFPEEQFSKHVASSDLSNYKIVKKGQFAYNPSLINVGSIARLDNWDNAVLSPMYTVFEIKEDVVNSDYFLHWLHSHRANQEIKTCTQGGVRAIVNFSDFASISLYVPEKRKQDEIADVLKSMQKEITLLRQLSDKYKLQKQGLMQKLLTGQWRIK